MLYFIMTLIILIAILLVAVILFQEPKGGLSRQFGGSGVAQNTTAVPSTADMLERITWILAAAMLVLVLGLTKITGVSSDNTSSPVFESIEPGPLQEPVVPEQAE